MWAISRKYTVPAIKSILVGLSTDPLDPTHLSRPIQPEDPRVDSTAQTGRVWVN